MFPRSPLRRDEGPVSEGGLPPPDPAGHRVPGQDQADMSAMFDDVLQYLEIVPTSTFTLVWT